MTVLAILLGLLALLVLAGVVYQAAGVGRDARRFPAPGRMIEVDGYRLHIRVMEPEHGVAPGTPTVLLEAGIAASSLSWSKVAPEVAKFARVVSYDRAGLGWSDASPRPRTPPHIVEELHALLDRAGVPRPLVLVGHSFGGYCVRYYAHKFPDEVVGMVLVDSVHPAEWERITPQQRRMIRGAVLFSRIGELLTRVGFVRFVLERLERGATSTPKMAARAFGPSAEKFLGRIVGEVRKLPPEVLPQVRAVWCRPLSHKCMAAYVGSLPASAAVVASIGGLGALPLVVLSGSHHPQPRAREQEDLARLSSNSKHIIASESAHWILLDEPELVVEAIREVVEAARGRDK
ncbi:MAG: alpha/beta fold hydrolase [Acidobacteria bacterium]|nr:alpha/beta fold hydrolase [Acidobacteriota bacterium]